MKIGSLLMATNEIFVVRLEKDRMYWPSLNYFVSLPMCASCFFDMSVHFRAEKLSSHRMAIYFLRPA